MTHGLKAIFGQSIRNKLMVIFILLGVILCVTNLLVAKYVNHSLRRVDTVYSSNLLSNELSEKIQDVQTYLYEYLNTKSTGALENYYRSEQEFKEMLLTLNNTITDQEIMMLETVIRNMSESYLEKADATIQAKRGRNVEKYKELYAQTKQLNSYVNAYIDQLSAKQLESNSNNYEQLVISLKTSEAVSVVIMIIVIVSSSLILLLILKSIINPLVQLAAQANEVAMGNFDISFEKTTSKDEIGVLTRSFNTMLSNIRLYIQRIKKDMEKERKLQEQQFQMENLLRQAQLKYLQAQINPHFLFNSLNAAAQLAMLEEAESTGLFLEKMADFFRYNVQKMDKDATLAEEIQSVDNYIYILNVRLAGDIIYEKYIDIQDKLDIKVPSMILQPIVENAFKYGIRNMNGLGKIELRVFIEDQDHLAIIVEDNGKGMPQETLSKIMNTMEIDKKEEDKISKSSTGVGLNNVVNRLRLYYKKENLFSIASPPKDKPMGTSIRIIIPLYNTGKGL